MATVLQRWCNASPRTLELAAIVDATGLNKGQVMALIPEPAAGTIFASGMVLAWRRK